jgi:hypothetical protein
MAVAELKNARDRPLLEALLDGLNVKRQPREQASASGRPTAAWPISASESSSPLPGRRSSPASWESSRRNADGVLGVLLELIYDTDAPATARVRACHDWLDALETYGQAEDLAARLAALEDAVEQAVARKAA